MKLTRQKPLELPKLEPREIWAIKAFAKGEASADQQALLSETILKKFCLVGGLSFDPDPYVTALNEGKRLVGLQLLFLINEPFDNLKMEKPNARSGRKPA